MELNKNNYLSELLLDTFNEGDKFTLWVGGWRLGCQPYYTNLNKKIIRNEFCILLSI